MVGRVNAKDGKIRQLFVKYSEETQGINASRLFTVSMIIRAGEKVFRLLAALTDLVYGFFPVFSHDKAIFVQHWKRFHSHLFYGEHTLHELQILLLGQNCLKAVHNGFCTVTAVFQQFIGNQCKHFTGMTYASSRSSSSTSGECRTPRGPPVLNCSSGIIQLTSP